jgi:hypothetical protein
MSVLKRAMLVAMAISAAEPISAQLTSPVKSGDDVIVVTGRAGKSQVEMSDWRMAETPHVIVFGKGDEKALARTARNLETLHFLLSMLLNRVDRPDETLKIAVTMIGDAGDFEQLRLTNLRWQYGPFPAAFPKTIYYDPREEGPVLATTADGVKIMIEPSRGALSQRNCEGGDDPVQQFGTGGHGFAPLSMTQTGPAEGSPGASPNGAPIDQSQLIIGEVSFCQSAEARLYSAFAQNYLMTYLPGAYPRWYLQGFGEMFSTMQAGPDWVEYGRIPVGFHRVMQTFGSYPVADVLNGNYLKKDRHWHPAWTPYQAWRMVHLLFFSEEWRRPLRAYFTALKSGADDATAAAAFGDIKVLQKAVSAYNGRKLPYERMNFPAERIHPAVIRRLTRAEAGLVRGRLELGARIELPAPGSEDLVRAVNRRSAWLSRLRDNAVRFPNFIENQLLLAEAECRSGNSGNCLAAADRALNIAPSQTTALVWKGTALAQLAVVGPKADRLVRLKHARAIIAEANRADPQAVLPLIAYYNSFAIAGEAAPDDSVDGLFAVVDSAPAAPRSRLLLGKELVGRDLGEEARDILLPVANGPFQSPEKADAQALLPPAMPSNTHH